MSAMSVARDFEARVGAEIRLTSEGNDRFRVSSPFQFDDGDHLVIVMKREGDRWVLTDEAHTLMHLSYWADDEEMFWDRGVAAIDRVLSTLSVERRDGELVLPVSGDEYGKALYRFIRALLRAIDVTMLSRRGATEPSAGGPGKAAA